MTNEQINMAFGGGCIAVGVTGIIFIIFKVCGVIDWSWLWITAPFWSPIAVYLVTIAVLVVIAGIRDFIERRKRKIWR